MMNEAVAKTVGASRSGAARDSVNMSMIRASIETNCDRYAQDSAAAALAMDLMLTLRRTATVFQVMADRYTREFGLSPAKVVIVMALAATERHELAQAAISRQMSVSLGNLTALVASLENDGIIRRRVDPKDGRVTLISLTPAGLRLVKRFAPIHYALVARSVSAVSAQDQRTMIRLLDEMRERYAEPAPGRRAGP